MKRLKNSVIIYCKTLESSDSICHSSVETRSDNRTVVKLYMLPGNHGLLDYDCLQSLFIFIFIPFRKIGAARSGISAKDIPIIMS
jgi:hypothetical protein